MIREIQSHDGARLTVQVEGPERAPAVVFSHHLGGSAAVWDAQAKALAGRFRVVRYDTRGQGASEATPGPYDVDLLGRDALAVIDALGLDQVRFVGLSQGGMAGMWLAINHPERVAKLVLANTTPFIPNKPVWDELASKARAEGMAGIARQTIESWLSDGFKARAPEAVEAAVAVMTALSPEGYAANTAVLRDVDLRADLARIACPTLVIGGADDGPRGASAPVMANTIPDARLLIVPLAAHLSPLENPEAFTSALTEFLP